MIEFLLDYYVWVLVVLGIIIITIIGFLVDSKQKRKKKEAQSSPAGEVKTVEPLPEVNSQDAVPVVDARNQQVPTSVDNVIDANANTVQAPQQNQQVQPTMQQVEQPMPMNSTNTVNQMAGNVSQNVALNDQKPHFEPKEVAMPAQPQMPVNNENIVVPQPVNAVSINQPVQQSQPMSQQFQYGIPQQTNMQMPQQPIQNFQSVPPVVGNGQMVNNMNIQSNMQPQMQAIPNNQVGMSNVAYGNINNVQPQPVAYQNIPTQMPNVMPQQPVGTIPNVPVSQVAATPMQNQQPMNTSESVQAQPTVSAPSFGISFVTGETDGQANDDSWKL